MARNIAAKRVTLLTSFGTDGAATAALVLRKYPDAELLSTSAARLADTLYECANTTLSQSAKQKHIPAQIIICGLGIRDGFAAILDSLKRADAAGLSVTWLCGRGYMNEHRHALAQLCETVFTPAASNAECALQHLGLEQNEANQFLLELAADYVEGRKTPEERLWWHNYLRACADRFFQYDDTEAYPQAIHKLAAGNPLTENDIRVVKRWRGGGMKAVPLGNSAPMRKLRQIIAKLGPVEAPVLILGPSGSGKELAARLLHESSQWRSGPFIAVNCAVLSASEELAADRLFGHVAGAYTGAIKDSPGAFEAAEGGTLFLDEAGELPLTVQTQLLRALEEKEISPLGTIRTRPVNIRILAATNRPLLKMVREGTFRLDLYHRLNVLRVRVPSLAERKEDIKSIASGIVHELKSEGISLQLSENDWQTAQTYEWPGNIRQLVNLLRRAAYMELPLAKVIEEEQQQEREDCGESPDADKWSATSDKTFFLPETLAQVHPEEEIRRRYLRHVHKICGESTKLAAQALNITTNTLRAWL